VLVVLFFGEAIEFGLVHVAIDVTVSRSIVRISAKPDRRFGGSLPPGFELLQSTPMLNYICASLNRRGQKVSESRVTLIIKIDE
jgi:hypothetical protein